MGDSDELILLELESAFEESDSDESVPYAPDIEPTFGDPVQLEGRYEVDPVAGGKRFQGGWLVLDDGTRYVISYRPDPARFRFVDKRVVVAGRPYMPGRDTQHMMATHLEVHSMELAPGETPCASPLEELPAPPVVRTAGGLATRDGRWARVAGILESVQDDPDSYLGVASLRLPDGTLVRACDVPRSGWAHYVGKPVTVTSRVARAEGGGDLELIGWYAICEGEEA